MTHLALVVFGAPDDIFGSFGMWAFLSVGAVALFAVFLPITTWLEARRVTESSSDGAKASIEYLREVNRIVQLKTIEGLKIGGLIMTGVGIGVVALLWVLAGHTVAVCGVIPMLIGLAMLAYVYFLAAPVQ